MEPRCSGESGDVGAASARGSTGCPRGERCGPEQMTGGGSLGAEFISALLSPGEIAARNLTSPRIAATRCRRLLQPR
jgi:hypothetical protein